MFYEDLSEYSYQDEDEFTDKESGFYALWYRPAYTRLNIGWLEAGKPYPTGAVPAAFVEKLKAVQEVQWINICLGMHECDLCPEESAPEGNGEVRIPGVSGTAYAAPFLITHHITTHGYRPRRPSSMPPSPSISTHGPPRDGPTSPSPGSSMTPMTPMTPNACWSRAERTSERLTK
ncbi:DUF7919 family protein [Streptomyces antibioticus]|uniref:DUF7919 family protein n=1 Tax=Streptomyces antibioticus TaxID=1890 RepID=UPI00378E29F2